MEEQIFVIRTWIERSRETFEQYLDAVVFQIKHAEVRASFEAYGIIELLTVLCQVMVSQSAGESCKLYNPVFSVIKVQNKLFLLFLYFGAVLLFLLALLISLHHPVEFPVFLVLEELGICLSVEEHYINVSLCAPAAVATVSVLVRCPGHSLALESPSESAVSISAFGEVGDFSALNVDHSHIFVVPAAVSLVIA